MALHLASTVERNGPGAPPWCVPERNLFVEIRRTPPGTERAAPRSVTSRDSLADPQSPPSLVELAQQRGFFGRLVATRDGLDGLVLRYALAIVIFPHGAQKLLGWFGGGGWTATMSALSDGLGLPAFIVGLVIVIEFFGPIALALGIFSRLAALGIAAVMLGAALTRHAQHGFFMNWSGQQGGEGFEFHILALGTSLAIFIAGSGTASVDRSATERLALAEVHSRDF